jgi:hypothetical protein
MELSCPWKGEKLILTAAAVSDCCIFFSQDIPALMEKYSRDVAFLMGIPPNFVVSKSSLSGSTSNAQQQENTNTFTTNAQSVCKHLQYLLSDVHEVIYGKPANFVISPTPRISIEKMEDIKGLIETGLILPERGVEIVDALLRSQNLPESGAEGGQYARQIQKAIHMKPSQGSSSSNSK